METILRSPGTTDITGQDDAVVLIQKMNSYQDFKLNPYLQDSIPPMDIIHRCEDGSAGFAHFVGFVPVPDNYGEEIKK